ncbi:nitrilase-related carbon-nitrogen hydrolase [Nocardia sp. NPDC051030]|uniref:nitrilase-related carbon-nitrogen hydrolase n=1 Tax=Nocardia sp. NPDC051030 TaxID=3155162 RepID=UPI00343C6DBA
MKRLLLPVAAVVLSAVLWLLGTGLHPHPGFVALAPLPILLLAPRVSARMAFAAAVVSWLGGAYPFISYFGTTLEQPPLPTILLLGVNSLSYAGLIVLTRTLIRRGRPGAAMLALPAGWVLMEYLISLTGLIGAWWSVAYTQAGVLPVIQVAALTGWLGISFLIMLIPAVLAVLLDTTAPRAARIRCAAAASTVLLAVLGYGVWQLSTPAGRDPVIVGLVAVSQPEDFVPVDSADGRDMITRTVTEIDRLADRGARIVVLPEKSWSATESTLPILSGPLTEVANRRNLHVIAGLVLARGDTSINAAIDFPSGTVYAKHHLVPGLESDLTPGTESKQVPGTPWALAVCYDLDYPDLVRTNRTEGATLLLVPALDFREDRWRHSRMAVLRGVESGLAIARPAQLGDLVLSDAHGRILASTPTDIDRTRTILAALPQPATPTIYARFGDWFAGAAALLFAIAIYSAIHTRSATPAFDNPARRAQVIEPR